MHDSGYKTYRKSHFSVNQNKSAKIQNEFLLKRNDLIFIKGDKYSDESTFYYPFGSILKINDFSSMVVGGLSICFVKDNDFNNGIVWGLREYGKPPTIIYPRPRILVIKNSKSNEGSKAFRSESYDDSMNLCLSKENHNDILKAMFDDSILFEYDLTK